MKLEFRIESLESAARLAQTELAKRWKDSNGIAFSRIIDDYLRSFSEARAYCREASALEEEFDRYKTQFDENAAKRKENARTISKEVDSLNGTLSSFHF